MLFTPTEVNRTVKTISIMQAQTSWHLRMSPIFFKPVRLIIRQPIMTPKMPYKDVEAPAATISLLLHSAENILPAIAEIR